MPEKIATIYKMNLSKNSNYEQQVWKLPNTTIFLSIAPQNLRATSNLLSWEAY